VIDLLRQYTPGFLERHGNQAPPQVQDTLAKLAMCRTRAQGEHVYECPQCQHRVPVYNSCLDRHCPLCRGGRRAAWLDKTAELLLPKGFVKSRCFGGFSCRRRKAYLARCRTLLGCEQASHPSEPAAASDAEPVEPEKPTRLCPRCQTPLVCVSPAERVGWRSVVNGPHGPAWYRPLRHAIRWGCLSWYPEPPDG